MDNMNDIRLAIGTLTNRVREIAEKLDDLTAMAQRSVRLAELVDNAEAIVDSLPDALDKTAAELDPMTAMIAAGPMREIAQAIRQAMAERRTARVSAPAIESTG